MKKKMKKIMAALIVISLIPAWEIGKEIVMNKELSLISQLLKTDTFFLISGIEKFIQNDTNFIILTALIMILPFFTLVNQFRKKESSQKLNLKEKVKLLRSEAINYNKDIIPVKVNSRRKNLTRGEEELMSKINLMRNYGR